MLFFLYYIVIMVGTLKALKWGGGRGDFELTEFRLCGVHCSVVLVIDHSLEIFKVLNNFYFCVPLTKIKLTGSSILYIQLVTKMKLNT